MKKQAEPEPKISFSISDDQNSLRIKNYEGYTTKQLMNKLREFLKHHAPEEWGGPVDLTGKGRSAL